jgi:enoyl-CoA hydratase/carnithine racemase
MEKQEVSGSKLQVSVCRPPARCSPLSDPDATCNLALACDYRIASDTAKLGQSFVRIGLHPDWGGTWLLPRIIGRSGAVELLMTGRLVDAAKALALGMVDRVISAGDLPGAATELARAMAAGPPLAIGGIKRALLASERNDLPAQLDLEAENQMNAFLSAYSSEGMEAFFEKRPPRFRGN